MRQLYTQKKKSLSSKQDAWTKKAYYDIFCTIKYSIQSAGFLFCTLHCSLMNFVMLNGPCDMRTLYTSHQHDLTFAPHSCKCTAHQMEIFAQEFEPASYFCDRTYFHMIMRRQKQGPILENEILQKMKLSKNIYKLLS